MYGSENEMAEPLNTWSSNTEKRKLNIKKKENKMVYFRSCSHLNHLLALFSRSSFPGTNLLEFYKVSHGLSYGSSNTFEESWDIVGSNIFFKLCMQAHVYMYVVAACIIGLNCPEDTHFKVSVLLNFKTTIGQVFVFLF